MGRAKSYAERLFDFPQVGALSSEAATIAIAKPASDQGVQVNHDALQRIIQETHGYPYFLQEWGKHAWDAAEASPITLRDVELASQTAIAALDESFFRVRFDRLTPLEKKYLRAMAELGSGPHRSGDISDQLNREVTSLGPTRSQLIAKGMGSHLWRSRPSLRTRNGSHLYFLPLLQTNSGPLGDHTDHAVD